MTPTRHIIQIGERRMHYRRWGEGPAVLVLHGSPQSSVAVLAQAEAIACAGGCAIMPDTPGNGLSCALPDQKPSSTDYAIAMHAFADALGLGRIGLYGYHTGAATACTFAALYPNRTSAVAFDGLCCWTEGERRDLLANYLPPFTPAWDGSHMAWLWARLEAQTVFFPWYATSAPARLAYHASPLASLQNNAIDFLDSGDAYRAPYASAFAFRAEDALSKVACPFLLAITANDPLRAHLSRAPLNAHNSRVFDTGRELYAAAADLFATHPGDNAPTTPPAPRAAGFSHLDRGQIYWRANGGGSERPLVLLHEAGGSTRTFDPVVDAVGHTRLVIRIDLPGHGASHEDWTDPINSVSGFAEVVGEVITRLSLDSPELAGVGVGGLIAAHLAVTAQAGAGMLLGSAPTPENTTGPIGEVSLAAAWDGAHLIRAFRIARWEALYVPWRERSRAHAITDPTLDTPFIHARAIDLIKAHDRWNAACLAQTRFDPVLLHHPAVTHVEGGPGVWANAWSGGGGV